MRMAQVSAETINPAHPAAHFSGGNLETVDRVTFAVGIFFIQQRRGNGIRQAVYGPVQRIILHTRDGMRMAQVSAETINPAHPAAHFSGGNLETLSDKPGRAMVSSALTALRSRSAYFLSSSGAAMASARRSTANH
jgi:secreted Zn-dependent insulinase-like peptidase